MPTSQRYFSRVQTSSNKSFSVFASASEVAAGERARFGVSGGDDFVCPYEEPPGTTNCACSESKNDLTLSSGINIKSCTHRPGKASSCARVHFTPCGIKRLAGGNTASACALVPMRHNRLSVLRRAPLQLGHSV